MNEQLVKRLLEDLGLSNDPRWDANATVVFTDQLREIESELYEELFPAMKGSQFVPIKTGINPGAEQWGYYMMSKVGVAKIIANYADDLEDVALMMDRHFVDIKGIGKKYSWSIQDVRAAAMAGVPLETEKAFAARTSIAWKMDDMAAVGESTLGMYGLLNHPNVGLISPVTGTWSSATAAQMIADVAALINGVNNLNKNLLPVNQVTMANSQLQLLTQTLMSTSAGTSLLVIEVLRKMFPGVAFDEWDKTELADASGTGPRIVAYHKNRRVVEQPVPVSFEQFPPQAKNLKFEVPCHGRVGGVVCRFPFAVGYMDGC